MTLQSQRENPVNLITKVQFIDWEFKPGWFWIISEKSKMQFVTEKFSKVGPNKNRFVEIDKTGYQLMLG